MSSKDNKNKKDIREWAKKLKHDKKFAEKYEGLKTVEGILATAKKDGYDIDKEELVEFDLDSVAGGLKIAGIETNVDVRKAELQSQKLSVTAGQNASITGNISQSQKN